MFVYVEVNIITTVLQFHPLLLYTETAYSRARKFFSNSFQIWWGKLIKKMREITGAHISPGQFTHLQV